MQPEATTQVYGTEVYGVQDYGCETTQTCTIMANNQQAPNTGIFASPDTTFSAIAGIMLVVIAVIGASLLVAKRIRTKRQGLAK